jgi:PPM family protein phosphatase
MHTCPQCQTSNRVDSNFCVKCGTSLAPIERSPVHSSVATRPTIPLNSAASPPILDDLTLPNHLNEDEPNIKSLIQTPSYEPLCEANIIGKKYIVNQAMPPKNGIQQYYVVDLEDHDGFFLLKESLEWQNLQNEIEIVQRQLQGPGLRPPLYAFQQQWCGVMRYYLLLPLPGDSLDDWQHPPEMQTIINWGASLAHGLAALHSRQIAFGTLNREQIGVEGDEAYLVDFGQVILSPQPGQDAEDVRQLALLLYQYITGEKEYSPQVDLPESLKGLFAQLLTSIQSISAADFASALQAANAHIRRPPDSIDLRVGRRTDVGVVRQLNEDSLCVMELVWNNKSMNLPIGLYIVADGMGGHEGGEIASGMTIKEMAQRATQELFSAITTNASGLDYGSWLKQAVEAANTAVYNRSKQSRNDMGTTVVAALVVGDEAYIAHVGDSRAYYIDQATIEPITTDHSLVERLVATNQISREEARYHPQSNVIYRTIGDKSSVEVDLSEQAIAAGDYLLLCSDGLTGMVEDTRIHQIVVEAPSPQAACDALVDAANAAGGEDNVTVILVKVEALT